MGSVTFLRRMERHTRPPREHFAITPALWARFCAQLALVDSTWTCSCEEYSHRYQKIHTCLHTLAYANQIFPYGDPAGRSGKEPKPFARAMPDEFKYATQALTLLLLTNVH